MGHGGLGQPHLGFRQRERPRGLEPSEGAARISSRSNSASAAKIRQGSEAPGRLSAQGLGRFPPPAGDAVAPIQSAATWAWRPRSCRSAQAIA